MNENIVNNYFDNIHFYLFIYVYIFKENNVIVVLGGQLND